MNEEITEEDIKWANFFIEKDPFGDNSYVITTEERKKGIDAIKKIIKYFEREKQVQRTLPTIKLIHYKKPNSDQPNNIMSTDIYINDQIILGCESIETYFDNDDDSKVQKTKLTIIPKKILVEYKEKDDYQ